VSVGPEPNVDVGTIEQTRRHIQRLFEEVARLSELDLAPADFFGEFLKRVLTALAAPAGAVWMRTPQGNLQLQYQVNLQQLALGRSEQARQSHDELLRLAFQQPRPLHLPPQSFAGQPEGNQVAPGNPTDYILLLVPIQVENQVDGLLEVWQNPDRNPAAINGFLQFMTEMSQLASRYLRNRLMRQMAGQQALWTQLESFSRQIHNSLNPVEVSYVVANEGRRLIDCDRVSIGVRYSRKCKVEAVSGADVVEKRSNLVQLMQKLFDRVLRWGEKLVYTGVQEEGLPPDVHKALDEYLAESNSKFLVVLPLKDEREKESKKPPRAVMMMECFETTATPEQLTARMEVVGRHATSALYNGVEHRRIPFRFLWMPLAKVQEGLGGKARAIAFLVALGLVGLVAAMIFVPYTLKVDGQGSLLTEERVIVYSPVEAVVTEAAIEPGAEVRPGQNILRLRSQQLADSVLKLDAEIATAEANANALQARLNDARNVALELIAQWEMERNSQQETARFKRREREELVRLTGADPDRPGYFWLKAPPFGLIRRPDDLAQRPEGADPFWTVLTPDFKETLPKRRVEPKDPLLRLGHKEGKWEIELKIPQKHIGQVLAAFDYVEKTQGQKDVLDVDLIVKSEPTKTYRGKLERSRIASEASPHKDANDQAEPVVLAWVRIEGDDIPKDRQVPERLRETTGVEVKAKVRCGKHPMGYSLFYGVWEFFYEKVVFFF
jgi:hypothetical protein